ncbi:MAG: hypothetical protein ACREPT_10435, partial [Rudaea sp.]
VDKDRAEQRLLNLDVIGDVTVSFLFHFLFFFRPGRLLTRGGRRSESSDPHRARQAEKDIAHSKFFPVHGTLAHLIALQTRLHKSPA